MNIEQEISLAAQKAVKDSLDPAGFLNPDKIFVEKDLEVSYD